MSPTLFASWKDKIVELDNKVLKYYKEKKNGTIKLKGVLNFDLYSVVL